MPLKGHALRRAKVTDMFAECESFWIAELSAEVADPTHFRVNHRFLQKRLLLAEFLYSYSPYESM
jgi:hypothetical protein